MSTLTKVTGVVLGLSLTSLALVAPGRAGTSGASSTTTGGAGFCRNQYSGPQCAPGKPKATTTTTACGPDLFEKAEHELETAGKFIDAGVKELNEVGGNIEDFRNDYAKESAEVGTEKLGLLNILETLSETAAEAAEVTGIYVGIGVLVEQLIFDVYPLLKDAYTMNQDAERNIAQGQEYLAAALADMKEALAEGPCLGPLEDKLKAFEDQANLDERAHALIDSWENNGAVYIDPVTNDVLDEAAALKKAKAQLAAGQGAQLSQRGAEWAMAASASSGVSKTQLQTCLSYVEKSMADHQEAVVDLAILSRTINSSLAVLNEHF